MGTMSGNELSSWEKKQDSEIGIPTGGSGGGGAKEERILVSVRLRPLNEKEIRNGDLSDWDCTNDTTIVFRNNLQERSLFPPIAYTFDRVFSCDSSTRSVYEESAKEIALSAVNGINSSIFAYGQTSSGKTYTMSGITEYSIADIYDYIQKHDERSFVLKFSAMEIYNEAVRDLLSLDPTPLRLLDDPERGTIVEKLTEETPRDWNHLKQLLSVCEAQRQIGETSLNESSSRSHQILRLTIESSPRHFLGKNSSSTIYATVNFVDLAGSERASQAMSAGTRLKEGCHINRSLLTLGTVIRKLSKGRNGHVPYRDSKLTRILQNSLGTNARTAIICTVSPARSYIEQSRNTLLFASCAKQVVTSAHVNVVMSDKALVKHLQRELTRLEDELRLADSTSSTVSVTETLLKAKDFQIKKMEKEINELTQQRDLAQSRLQNSLQSVGDHYDSRHWEIHESSMSNMIYDGNSMSETSSICYHDRSFNAAKSLSIMTSLDYANDNNVSDLLRNLEAKHHRSSQASHCLLPMNTTDFVVRDEKEDAIVEKSLEEFEDLCKEVHCIEMDESSMSVSMNIGDATPRPPPPSPPILEDDIDDYDVQRKNVPQVQSVRYLSNHLTEGTVCTLEEQLQNAKKMDVKRNLNELFPLPLDSGRSSGLGRSRSCERYIVQSPSPSPWSVDDQECDNTPPGKLLSDFPGRPKGLLRRGPHTIDYDGEGEHATFSGEASQTCESRFSTKRVDESDMSEEEISSSHDCVEERNAGVDVQTNKEKDVVRDVHVGLNLGESLFPSPARWPVEFGKQQREIILLWKECNVSLIHRTYFFHLFKGDDPTDSIYLEVELRRLVFLNRTFNNGDAFKAPVEDGCTVTPASSIRALRRERVMLSRKMSKIFSSEEREAIYHQWGIALDSKKRRMQLASSLWTGTEDMVHIRESATIIAKLIGLFQQGGQALKEMFGLSFTPQRGGGGRRRSFGWRHL